MSREIDAVYEDGVLRPVTSLPLCEKERVRVHVESDAGNRDAAEPVNGAERDRRLKAFFETLDRNSFRSDGPYPSRDELHER